MGVLKNEVGRPSKKIMKIRLLIKLIILIIIIGGTVLGIKYLKVKEEKKKIAEKEKQEQLEKKEKTIDERYPNLEFVSQKIIENDTALFRINADGSLYAIRKSDNKEVKINIDDYYNDGKAVVEFQTSMQSAETHYAMLTEQRELFVATVDYASEIPEMNFVKTKLRPEYIGTTNEIVINTKKFNGIIIKPLFVYRKNAMYMLDCSDKPTFGDRYGLRYVTGAWNESGSIPLLVMPTKNNKLYYLEDIETVKIRELKYKGKAIKTKFIMQTSNDDLSTFIAYVITNDNNILSLKIYGNDKDSNQEEINNIKLYRSNVIDYKYSNENMDVVVTYKDGSTEKFENLSAYKEYEGE